MKVILSRKGFDSDFGGYPSIITPEGKLVSFPIPTTRSKTKQYDNSAIGYKDLKFDNQKTYLTIMQELGYTYDEDSFCHLDPDIYEAIYPRQSEWKGAFGQVGAAQSHLESFGISAGDIFLFFGWFRHTEYSTDGQIKLKKDDPDKHVIFGYLQIDKIIRISNQTSLFSEPVPEWVTYHPHLGIELQKSTNNTIYIGRKNLTFAPDLPGFGPLTFKNNLVLTKPGSTRTKWSLPEFMRKLDISYHTKDNWKDDYFQSASRGQEFVLSQSPELEEWVKNLILPSR